MAIKPNELEEHILTQGIREIDLGIEQRIMGGIIEEVDGERKIFVQIPQGVLNNHAILSKVVSRYIVAGWDVGYSSTSNPSRRGESVATDTLSFTYKL